MSNETAIFISDRQREAVLKGIFTAVYDDVPAGHIVFDTNRLWCTKMPVLAALFPQARVIGCVCDIPAIFDSMERLIRKNHVQPSGIFNFDPSGTVYSRTESLGSAGGLVGFAWHALREAFFGEQSDRLMVLSYETLTAAPERAIAAIYDFLGEQPFAHDFENVEFDASEFDRRLGTPGLHAIARRVRREERRSILPPDLIHKYEKDSFWRDPTRYPSSVKVV
jgi:sulfotransferase